MLLSFFFCGVNLFIYSDQNVSFPKLWSHILFFCLISFKSKVPKKSFFIMWKYVCRSILKSSNSPSWRLSQFAAINESVIFVLSLLKSKWQKWKNIQKSPMQYFCEPYEGWVFNLQWITQYFHNSFLIWNVKWTVPFSLNQRAVYQGGGFSRYHCPLKTVVLSELCNWFYFN